MSRSRSHDWSRLDNAAKIFPPVSGKDDTKVFRFSCELFEEVDEGLLQRALDRTLEDFPGFGYVLKRGMFWYYLEENAAQPPVRLEDAPPCGILYRDSRSPLFEVTYFGPRVNLEVYHALTDGTGAVQFLKTLVCYYLTLRHADSLKGLILSSDFDASAAQRMNDSFAQHYTGNADHRPPVPKAGPMHRLRGARTPERRLKIIEGVVPADRVLECARARGVSLTALLTAALMCAIHEDMTARERKRLVGVSIPINLRKYFNSQSVRNFFSVINVAHDFSAGPTDLDGVALAVKDYLARELTPEYLQARLDRLGELENRMVARIVPLPVKNLILRFFYRRSEKAYTTTLSNIGPIEMPEALRPHIKMFDVCNSTRDLQVCLCSFGNILTISFTAQLVGTDIQRRFFRTLTGMGIPVEIIANRFDQE